MKLSQAEARRRREDPTVPVVIMTLQDRRAGEDERVTSTALQLAQFMRDCGIPCVLDARPVRLPKKFEQAEGLGALYVVLLGPDDVAKGTVRVNSQDVRVLDDGTEVREKWEVQIFESVVRIGSEILPWERT